MGVNHHHFEHELSGGEAIGAAQPRHRPRERRPEGSRRTLQAPSQRQHVGSDFPQDPFTQLEHAIEAVFKSWMGDRAHPLPRAERDPRAPRGRPSTCSPWSSETWATTAPPAWPSRAIPRPARTSSTASSSSTPRAKTSSPASALPSPATAWESGARKLARAAGGQGPARTPLQGRAGL